MLKSHGRGNLVQVTEGKWRPLVVEVGALGSVTGVSKIAASVIGPLADHNVSVYCASTNQEDYVLVSPWHKFCVLYMCVHVCVLTFPANESSTCASVNRGMFLYYMYVPLYFMHSLVYSNLSCVKCGELSVLRNNISCTCNTHNAIVYNMCMWLQLCLEML